MTRRDDQHCQESDSVQRRVMCGISPHPRHGMMASGRLERASAPVAAGPEHTAMIRATSSSTASASAPARRNMDVATPTASPFCACGGGTNEAGWLSLSAHGLQALNWLMTLLKLSQLCKGCSVTDAYRSPPPHTHDPPRQPS